MSWEEIEASSLFGYYMMMAIAITSVLAPSGFGHSIDVFPAISLLSLSTTFKIMMQRPSQGRARMFVRCQALHPPHGHEALGHIGLINRPVIDLETFRIFAETRLIAHQSKTLFCLCLCRIGARQFIVIVVCADHRRPPLPT